MEKIYWLPEITSTTQVFFCILTEQSIHVSLMVWRTLSSTDHVLQDNVCYGTKMPVKLYADDSTPLHETEKNNDSITNWYNYPLYKLNIPPY